MPDVRAAGCVVWRSSAEGVNDHEVLVAHRPRYDDWSFPKGKLDGDETFIEAARREVDEETGASGAIGAELEPVTYVDHKGRSKIVRYWLMAADPSFDVDRFEPNEEVDVISWMSLADAAEVLTYGHDRALVAQAAGLLNQP